MIRKMTTIIIFILCNYAFSQEQNDFSPQQSKIGLFVFSTNYDAGTGLNLFLGNKFAIRANVGFNFIEAQPSTDYSNNWNTDKTLSINWMVEGLLEIIPLRNFVIGIGPGFGIDSDYRKTEYNNKASSGPYVLDQLTNTYRGAVIIDFQFFTMSRMSIFADFGFEALKNVITNNFTFPNGSTSKTEDDSSIKIGTHYPSIGAIFYF